MLHSLHSPLLCSISPFKNRNPHSLSTSPSPSPSPHPPSLLRFRTSHRQNLRYLGNLGVIDLQTGTHQKPSPETLNQILSTVNFLKSKGFSDPDFPRLAFLCPELFSPNSSHDHIELVFNFLTSDLAASVEQSRGLVLRCPQILNSNVEFCLRPTLIYLQELGLQNLNSPTNLNAHLLNTRVHKLEEKIRFLRSIGLTFEESAKVCARLPAIFGYSVENNLRPKFEYLVREMKRKGVEELMEFPQYFAFSLGKKIVPRHLHLKQRNVRLPLKTMLLWSDQRFYAKFK